MPVLRVLASRSSAVTAAQIARVSERGTEAGIRRATERLTRQGVLRAQVVGERTVYRLNYDHVLYEAVTVLLRVEEQLERRLVSELEGWSPQPVSAALYGSAARRDGDEDSDIDLLLVRPSLRSTSAREAWAAQVHRLRDSVFSWTGNEVQIVDRSLPAIRRLVRAQEPIVAEWRQDAVTLAGLAVPDLLAEL